MLLCSTQAAAVNELLELVNSSCYKKCVTSPGSTLSNKEQTCLAMCFDRFLDVQQIVVNAVNNRGQDG